MNGWIAELQDLANRGEAACIVTVAGVRGSTPRDAGAKMIVAAKHAYSTIGGGELEYQCTRLACQQLGTPRQPTLRKFTLGASCGQCCGGVVEVLFESQSADMGWLDRLAQLHAARQAAAIVTPIDATGKFVVTAGNSEAFASDAELDATVIDLARSVLRNKGEAIAATVKDDAGHDRRYMIEPVTSSDFNIALFGAGHVGVATVAALTRLDCSIRWIDSRRNIFPKLAADNLTIIEAEQPSLEVAALPADAFYLVMTHSHALDFEICDRVLRREDFAYCGLIGSRSKRRRFERLMRQQTMPEDLLRRLTCPIGIGGIDGKQPEEIAVAVTAQLLRLRSTGKRSYIGEEGNVHYFQAVKK